MAQSDYMAFFVYNGEQVISFVQIGKLFFGYYGKAVMISPITRIIRMSHDLKKNYAKLQFYGLEGNGGTLELDLTNGKKLKEFCKRFVKASEEDKGFLSAIFGSVSMFPKISRPVAIKIDMEELVNKAIKLTGKDKYSEITLPDNLKVLLNEKKNEYTTMKRIGVVPIYYYTLTDIKDKRGKNLKEALVKYAWRF
jgi:hypothetical protein